MHKILILLLLTMMSLSAAPKRMALNHDLIDTLAAYWSLDAKDHYRQDRHLLDERHLTHLQGFNLTAEEGVSKNTGTSIGLIEGSYAAPVYGNTSALALEKSYLQMPAGTPFAIAFWVRFDSISGGKKFFVTKDRNAGTQKHEYSVSWNATSERFEFAFGSGGANEDVVSGEEFYTAHGVPQTGVWYFIVANRGSSQNISISVNLLQDTVPTTELGGIGSPSPDFRLGQTSDGAGSTDFEGRLDEVAVWKGRNIGGESARFLYNDGKGRSYQEIYLNANPRFCPAITCCN